MCGEGGNACACVKAAFNHMTTKNIYILKNAILDTKFESNHAHLPKSANPPFAKWLLAQIWGSSSKTQALGSRLLLQGSTQARVGPHSLHIQSSAVLARACPDNPLQGVGGVPVNPEHTGSSDQAGRLVRNSRKCWGLGKSRKFRAIRQALQEIQKIE